MRPDNSASTRKLVGEKKILVEGKGGDPFADLIKEGCCTADREWKTVYESYPALILPSGDTQTREGRPKIWKTWKTRNEKTNKTSR
jgi:hypothetical protein